MKIKPPKTQYVCSQCGTIQPKWVGKCPDCNAWNSFVEESTVLPNSNFYTLSSHEPTRLGDVCLNTTARISTGQSEIDRVLGGGLVPGSLVLLGGDPGIGKSTLVLALLSQVVSQNLKPLYVTGEESVAQIRLRSERLGASPEIHVVSENNLDRILEHTQKFAPAVLVVDSIQTVFLPLLESAPGSVSQVRECAGKLLYFAKTTQTTVLLVGHVTKEGAIAGPRTLEHMVDTVLYIEGESSGQYRILRSIKNRYGSTAEMAVLAMTAKGLVDVENPSQIFLGQRQNNVVGSCITATQEGSRPLLVEVQALVSHSVLANPRRTAVGIDSFRLALILAVLEKGAGIAFYQKDVYVNAAGGIKLNEPATDLAVAVALISSFYDKPLSANIMAVGELGLGGEIRPVAHIESRANEALKLGYIHLLLPKMADTIPLSKNAKLKFVSHVKEILDLF